MFTFIRCTSFTMESDHIIILGAQKCGTSTLFKTLISHAEIAPPIHPFSGNVVKEVGFFDLMWHRGFDWYASFFPSNARFTIDASPNYLCNPDALQRIGRVFPAAKFIVSLRNPVERAISQHNHYQQMMPETRDWDWRVPGESFQQNVEAEFHSPMEDWSGILKRGLYVQQLQYLTQHINRQNLLILAMENWTRDPESTLHTLCDFLQVPLAIDELLLAHQRQDKASVPEGTIDQLERYYEQPNRKLFQWLGYQIDW